MFSKEETEALDALEAVFGPVDPLLHNVSSREDLTAYPRWIGRNIKDALIFWGQYKHALTVDWDAVEREKREKELAKRTAWQNEKLEGVMTGILAGLMPKLGKAGLMVEFDVSESVVSFTAETPDLDAVIEMSFNKADRVLRTIMVGDRLWIEDVSLLNGNQKPREQLKGLEAVHVWLDEREAAREAAGAAL